MNFHAMAMLTPGNGLSGPGSCGSRAFCGAKFETYPELPEINLGHPFDRPAPNGTLALINGSPNMAMMPFRIRFDPHLLDDLQSVPVG